MLFGRLGQVEFPARQVNFHSHLPIGQDLRQFISQLKGLVRLAQGKQNKRSANLLIEQAGIHLFWSPAICTSMLYLLRKAQKLPIERLALLVPDVTQPTVNHLNTRQSTGHTLFNVTQSEVCQTRVNNRRLSLLTLLYIYLHYAKHRILQSD